MTVSIYNFEIRSVSSSRIFRFYLFFFLLLSPLRLEISASPIHGSGKTEQSSENDGISGSSNTVELDCMVHFLSFDQSLISTIMPDGTFVGVSGSGMLSWKGIRFAEAPVGDLRWKAPVSPPKKNLGTVQANKVGKWLSQITRILIVDFSAP